VNEGCDTGNATFDSLFTNEYGAGSMKDQRLYAKCLASALPSICTGEKVESLETATTLNPWYDYLFIAPTLIMAIPELYTTLTVLIFVAYWIWFAEFVRRKGRVLVFTDQANSDT
jgi:hypothetical protein